MDQRQRRVIVHHNRKTSHISWRLRRTVKKMVRVNLLGLLNDAVTRPIKECLKPPQEDRRRSKLMSEFHLTPEKATPCHDLSMNSSTVSEVQYIDLSSPEFLLHSETTTLREQILNYSKRLIEQESDQFSPILLDSPAKSLKLIDDYDLLPMTHGMYLNFGITNNIQRIMRLKTNQRHLRDYSYPVAIKLDVAIYVQKTRQNGIKIARHLLILGRISNPLVLPVTEPFVIGVYQGTFPEANICNEILKPFVDEVRILENEFHIDARHCKLQLGTFICDPVANSLVTCSTLPNSIYGCNKCNQKTTLHEGTERISYSGTLSASDQRSDDDCRYYLPVDHFTGASLLSQLNVGMVSQFVGDYQHVVCFGVMRHLMKCWTTGKLDYRLNKNTLKVIAEKLKIVSASPPMEFERRIRAFEEIDKWEAFDWKMFLLYYGPLVLKSHLPENYYMNFLYLHLAMRIMTSSEYRFTTNECSSYIAGQLIATFVATFRKLYGQELINHSVHYLLHLEEIFLKMGSLEGVSGFEFSRQLEALKASLRFDANFDEVANHVIDTTEASLQNAENGYVPTYGPFVVNEKEELRLNNCTITTQGNDNVVITNSGVLQVERIQKTENGEVFLYARRFQKNVVVYQAPTTHQKLIVLGSLTQKPSKYDLQKFQYLFKGAKFETGQCTFLHPLTVY